MLSVLTLSAALVGVTGGPALADTPVPTTLVQRAPMAGLVDSYVEVPIDVEPDDGSTVHDRGFRVTRDGGWYGYTYSSTDPASHPLLWTGGWPAGVHTVTVTYEGNNDYAPSSLTTTITLERQPTMVTLDNMWRNGDVHGYAYRRAGSLFADVLYSSGYRPGYLAWADFIVTVADPVTGKVRTREAVSLPSIELQWAGWPQEILWDVPEGVYDVTVDFLGDASYEPSSATVRVPVYRTPVELNVQAPPEHQVGTPLTTWAWLYSRVGDYRPPYGARIDVALERDGEVVRRHHGTTDETGMFVGEFQTNDVAPGWYEHVTTYDGNDIEAPTEHRRPVYLFAARSVTTMQAATATYDLEHTFTARVAREDTGAPVAGHVVSFFALGRDGGSIGEAVTDADGVATLTKRVTLLPGDYVVRAVAENGNDLARSSGDAALRVDAAPVSLTFASPATVKVGSGSHVTWRVAHEGSGVPVRSGAVDVTVTAPSGATRTQRLTVSAGEVALWTQWAEHGSYRVTAEPAPGGLVAEQAEATVEVQLHRNRIVATAAPVRRGDQTIVQVRFYNADTGQEGGSGSVTFRHPDGTSETRWASSGSSHWLRVNYPLPNHTDSITVSTAWYQHEPTSVDVPVVVLKDPTGLAYVGQTHTRVNQPTGTFRLTTPKLNSAPVAGAAVEMVVAQAGVELARYSGVTDTNGEVVVPPGVWTLPGIYDVTARFVGDQFREPTEHTVRVTVTP